MPRNSSPPSRAHELTFKRALHPIHNVKQPKNNRQDQTIPIDHSRFLSFSRGQRTGGAERDRTDDLLLAKQALSQLSYGPNPLGPSSLKAVPSPRSRTWWAREDLNFRPHAYQARALTN